MRPINCAWICLLTLVAGTADTVSGSNGDSFDNENASVAIQILLERTVEQLNVANQARMANANLTSRTCADDLNILGEAAKRVEPWALKMIDASSKIPSGILEGNIVDMGNYDECMSIRGHSENATIKGRHCIFSIMPVITSNDSIPYPPTLSLCLPATCSTADLTNLLKPLVERIDVYNVSFTIEDVHCSPVHRVIWDAEFAVCFSFFLVFIGFVVACSVIHWNRIRRSRTLQVLACFSVRRNAALLLSTDAREGHLPVIHGIRFLSVAWILLSHQYIMAIIGPNINALHVLEWIQSWRSLLIFSAQFAVDTFFTLSGFLMAYIFLKHMSEDRKFNIFKYYLRRLIRLTIPVIALVVFSAVFLPKIGSGARWDAITDLFFGGCRKKCWATLFYLQNFIDKDNVCLAHLWYLAVEMQLFWISPFVLYPLYARPKIGLAILFSLMLASLIVPAQIVGANKYPVESFINTLNLTLTKKVFEDFYEMPYNRAGPWLVGILLGYDLSKNHRTLNKKRLTIGWLLAAGSFAFCIFGLWTFMTPDYKFNSSWETFFTVVSRPIWAVGICWIIYTSVYNCAGPIIQKVLSWKYFLPLSKLSYCIYLVHFVYQLVDVASLRTSMYFSDYNVWQAYLSKLIGSIGIAFVFSLLFEAPVLFLDKMIFQKGNAKTQSESASSLDASDREENLVTERYPEIR